VIFGVINYYAQFSSGALSHSAAVPADIRVSVIPLAYWFYPLKTLIPLDLIPFYPYPKDAPILLSAVALIFLITITVFLFLYRHKYKYLFFGWICYLIISSPMSGIFSTGGHAYADRYSYIANVGLLIIVIAAVYWAVLHFSGRMVSLVVIGFVSLLTYMSYTQASLWRDTYTLFSHTVNVQEDNYVALMKLAVEHIKNNKTNDAEVLIQQALDTNPHEARVYQFAAKHLYINNDHESSRKLLESALKNDVWQKGIIYRELAQYYLLKDDYDTAIKYATTAIEYRHETEAAYFIRGTAYRNTGDIGNAIRDIQKAISLNHQYTRAYIAMGDTLMSIGQTQDALSYYMEALKKNPSNKKLKTAVEQLTGTR
jgi:tetratricopeptide (TPR) repeat protein